MRPVQYSYEDFAEVPSNIFRLMGYDMLGSPRSRSKLALMRLYRFLCLASHCLCVGLMIFRIIEMKTINTTSLIMRYGTLVTYVIHSDTKYATALQSSAIQSLNKKLADLYPKTTLERLYYRVNDHYWPKTFIYLIRFYIGSSTLVVVGPIFQSVWFYFSSGTYSYLHCYEYFAFDPKTGSVLRYLGMYVLEWLHSTQMVISNAGTDILLICFQVQICMHFTAMIRSIEEHVPSSENDYADRQFLARMVNKHNYLSNLQKELNDIFGSSLLLSLLTTAAVICTVSVYSMLQGVTLEGISYVLFLATSVLQVYLVCYYGQQVLELSEAIAFAAYSHDFQDASIAYKKSLLIIITRAQKPVELSAMNYLPISLETFKQAGAPIAS
ncbi:hypothetical protein KR009_010371 [Drosophila setifemur]|nr:hypothetical protein KR009_010371 [Drosophila setifemur]